MPPRPTAAHHGHPMTYHTTKARSPGSSPSQKRSISPAHTLAARLLSRTSELLSCSTRCSCPWQSLLALPRLSSCRTQAKGYKKAWHRAQERSCYCWLCPFPSPHESRHPIDPPKKDSQWPVKDVFSDRQYAPLQSRRKLLHPPSKEMDEILLTPPWRTICRCGCIGDVWMRHWE